MRMVAAFARAGAVLAAAGALGAVLVVLTGMRVFAFAFVALAAMRTVGIDAAFGANTRSVIEVVAANQAVAAIELLAVVDRDDPANGTFRLATSVAIVDAMAVATGLALAAFPVTDAFGAVGTRSAVVVTAAFGAGGAVFVFAADQPGAADSEFVTGIRLAKRAVVTRSLAAGADIHTFPLATFLALAAFALADAPGAGTARSAVIVSTAFGAVAALTVRAAEQVVATVALGTGSARDGAGFA
jgi:hypothetical protein